jgi:hypothetical protein
MYWSISLSMVILFIFAMPGEVASEIRPVFRILAQRSSRFPADKILLILRALSRCIRMLHFFCRNVYQVVISRSG